MRFVNSARLPRNLFYLIKSEISKICFEILNFEVYDFNISSIVLL